MALLQFGTTLVFGVPPLWNNENQPDPRLRKMQAILGKCFAFCYHLVHFHLPLEMSYDIVWFPSRHYPFECSSIDSQSYQSLSRSIVVLFLSLLEYIPFLFCIFTTIIFNHTTSRYPKGHIIYWHSNSSLPQSIFHYTINTQPPSNNPTQSASLAPFLP